MATCKNCEATIPEGSQFCVECGTPVEPEKKGFLGLFKSKKKKDDAPQNDDIEKTQTDKDEISDEENVQSGDADFDSIEAEAKDWAEDAEDKPVISPDDLDLSEPEKRIVPTAVFIPRSKNNIADKSFGLLLFLIIAAIVVIGFVFSPGLIYTAGLTTSLMGYAPLLLLSLAMLISARSGNFDLALPGIMMVTYYLLMSGFSNMNFYTMLIICIGGAVCIGLLSGLLAAIAKVPSVFSGLVLLIIDFVYLDTMFNSGTVFTPTAYTPFSKEYIPISLLILSTVAVFVLIYLTKLGKPLYKRKGLTATDKLLYVLSFALASALAAGAGTIASIVEPQIGAELSSAVSVTFEYILGLIFIIAIAGSSTLFDNRIMPVVMVLIGFLLWFGIDVLISQTLLVSHGALVAAGAKVGFVLLALIGERVYAKSQVAEFYQTINVKK